ncbi:MAG: RNA polymerase sigma factor [Acidobacteriota bacterium]|nr:RNA polymerase sigma factor [Acidobacteriota bacterium]
MPILKEITVKDFEAEAMPYFNDIFRTALRLMKNRSEAKNLIEEVYLQAWKSFRFYRPEINSRAWLFKILFSKFNRYHQKNINFEFVEDGDDTLRNLDFILGVVAKTLSNEEIFSCLEHIPPVFREPMLLAQIEEFSYKEIIEILDIPIETVIPSISQGRKLLGSEVMKLADSYEVVLNEGFFV